MSAEIFIQGIRDYLPVQLLSVIRHTGDVLFIAIPFFIIFCVFWFRDRRDAGIMLMSMSLSVCLVGFFKGAIHQPRPWVSDPSIVPTQDVLTKYDGTFAFPSGHSTTAASSFGSLALYFRSKRSVLLSVSATIFVMFSRLLVGAHTPIQCLAGLCLGMICAVGIHILVSGSDDKRMRIIPYVVLIAVIVIQTACIFLPNTYSADGPIRCTGNMFDTFLSEGCFAVSAMASYCLAMRKPKKETVFDKRGFFLSCMICLAVYAVCSVLGASLHVSVWSDCIAYSSIPVLGMLVIPHIYPKLCNRS